jgi:hypothetical protein
MKITLVAVLKKFKLHLPRQPGNVGMSNYEFVNAGVIC